MDLSNHFLAIKKKTNSKKRKKEKRRRSSLLTRHQRSGSRLRYPTNFRLNSSRRRVLSSKNAYMRRYSSSCTTDLSSIAKIIQQGYKTDDEEYETCDGSDEAETTSEQINYHHWIKDAKPQSSSVRRYPFSSDTTEETWTDYTFITNDKSYSHVNFNPSLLPNALGPVWLESGARSFGDDSKVKAKINRKENRAEEASSACHSNHPPALRSKNATTSDNPPSCVLHVENETTKRTLAVKGDCNNNSQEQGRELWWDNSTDIGCKTPCIDFPVDKQKSMKTVSSKDESSMLHEAILTEAENFVVVDAALKQGKELADTNVDDVNNNIREVVGYFIEKNRNVVQSRKILVSQHDACPITSTDLKNQQRKQLGDDREAISDVISQEHVTTFDKEKGKPEICNVSDNAVGKENRVYSPLSPGHNAAVKLIDDDHAIVTVVHHHLSVADFENAASKTTNKTNDAACLNDVDIRSGMQATKVDSNKRTQQKQIETRRGSISENAILPNASCKNQNLKMVLLTTSTSVVSSTSSAWCPASFSTPACSNAENRELIDRKRIALLNSMLENADLVQESSQTSKKLAKNSNLAVVPARGVKSLPCSPPLYPKEIPSISHKNRSSSMCNLCVNTPGSLHIDCSQFNAVEAPKVHTPHSKTYKNTFLSATFSLQAKDKEKTYVITPICSSYDKIPRHASAFLKETDKFIKSSSSMNKSQHLEKELLDENCQRSIDTFHYRVNNNISDSSSICHPVGNGTVKTEEISKTSSLIRQPAALALSREHAKAKSRLHQKASTSKISTSSTCSGEIYKPNAPVPSKIKERSIQSCSQWKKATGKQKKRKSIHGKKKHGTARYVSTDKDSLSTYLSASQKSDFVKSKKENKQQNNKPSSSEFQGSKKEYASSFSSHPSNAIDKVWPENVLENLVVPIKEAVIPSKYMEKVPKTASSNTLVGTRAPPRRSPRNLHSNMPIVKSSSEEANRQDDTPSQLVSTNSKLFSHLHDTFDNKNKMKQEGEGFENLQLHSTNPQEDLTQQNMFQFTSTSFTTVSPLSAQGSTKNESTRTVLAHGRVKSSIKSIVNNLVSKSVSSKINPPVSPCLAALQAGESNKVRDTIPFKKDAPSITFFSKVKKRTNSAPTSPAYSSTIETSHRSASLSDVFYDSTVNNSTTISFLTCRSSKKKKKMYSLKPSSKEDAKSRSTYISFSPPTISPPGNKELKDNDEHGSLKQKGKATISMKYPAATTGNLKVMEVKIRDPVGVSNRKLEESCDWDKDRPVRRILDQDIEEEIRKSAEMLIESVLEMSHPSLKTMKPFVSNEARLCDIQQAAVPTPIKSLEKDTICSSPGTSLQDEQVKSFERRRKSNEKCTQTAKLVPLKNPKEPSHDKHLGTANFKLNVPPRKPPRSNSPNALREATSEEPFSLGNKHSKPIADKEAMVRRTTTNNIMPPFVSFCPLLTPKSDVTFEQQQSQYVSPTILPANNAEQHINLNQCVPSATWHCATQCDSSGDSLSKLSFSQENKAGATGEKMSCATEQPAYLTNPPVRFPVLNTSKMPNSLVRFNTSARFAQKLHGKSNPLYLLPPMHSRSRFPCRVPNFQHLLPKRRRSFSGISSAAVAKARLNRRFFNQITKKKFWKHPYVAELNYSHPAMHRPVRRPRFVRSSLTDDTVFESVKENCQVFVTKPLSRKVSNAAVKECDLVSNTKCQQKEKDKLDGSTEPVKNNLETGCLSEVEASSESKHDVAEKPNNSSIGLDVILEDYSQIEMENKEVVIAPAAKISTKSVSEPSGAKNSKKGHKFSTLQRLKRYVSGSIKGGKQDPGVETKMLPRRCKTDSKLARKEISTSSIKRDHIRDMFRKSKKVISEKDTESTLKAECTASNHSSATPKANDPYQTLRLRETYDLKSSLFSPSFVVIATAEINTKDQSDLKEDVSSDQATSSTAELADCTAVTIRRHSDQQSVATPGLRINSETGDVIEEAKPDMERKRLHKLLSSTAIDEGSYLPAQPSGSTENASF